MMVISTRTQGVQVVGTVAGLVEWWISKGRIAKLRHDSTAGTTLSDRRHDSCMIV